MSKNRKKYYLISAGAITTLGTSISSTVIAIKTSDKENNTRKDFIVMKTSLEILVEQLSSKVNKLESQVKTLAPKNLITSMIDPIVNYMNNPQQQKEVSIALLDFIKKQLMSSTNLREDELKDGINDIIDSVEVKDER